MVSSHGLRPRLSDFTATERNRSRGRYGEGRYYIKKYLLYPFFPPSALAEPRVGFAI